MRTKKVLFSKQVTEKYLTSSHLLTRINSKINAHHWIEYNNGVRFLGIHLNKHNTINMFISLCCFFNSKLCDLIALVVQLHWWFCLNLICHSYDLDGIKLHILLTKWDKLMWIALKIHQIVIPASVQTTHIWICGAVDLTRGVY